MWTFLVKALAWVSTGAFGGLANGVVSVLNKRSDTTVAVNATNAGAAKDVDLAAITAGTAAFHDRLELSRLQWGWAGTRWLLFCAAAPAIIHSGAVYLDSTFRFGWAIARAPGVYEGQELQIIAAVCGFQVAQPVVGALARWLAAPGK